MVKCGISAFGFNLLYSLQLTRTKILPIKLFKKMKKMQLEKKTRLSMWLAMVRVWCQQNCKYTLTAGINMMLCLLK